MNLLLHPQRPVEYPETDGQPMADNTLQFEWIVTIKGDLEALFRHDATVFVAGDLLWYPVEGDNTIRQAPDTMVAFGRPKGRRGSYRQWEEAGVAPQVVFEVLSPGNRVGEMVRKLRWYERYGVEEYYVYDPDRLELTGWQRAGAALVEIPDMNGWVSPRLRTRFEMGVDGLRLYKPNGEQFLIYVEGEEQRERERHEKEQALRQAARLAAQLRALGIEPEE